MEEEPSRRRRATVPDKGATAAATSDSFHLPAPKVKHDMIKSSRVTAASSSKGKAKSSVSSADGASTLGRQLPCLYKDDSRIVWARMSGFPSWPARYCSKIEQEAILSMRPSRGPQQTGSCHPIAVLFLGRKCTKAWIWDASIHRFIPETLEGLFQLRRFRQDRDYRAAVVEALRISIHAGYRYQQDGASLHKSTDGSTNGSYSNGANGAVDTVADDPLPASPPLPSPFDLELMRTCEPGLLPLELPAGQCCVECGGTALSGSLMQCYSCQLQLRHWHCFALADSGAWMCDECCKSRGLSAGSVIPFDDDDAVVDANDAPGGQDGVGPVRRKQHDTRLHGSSTGSHKRHADDSLIDSGPTGGGKTGADVHKSAKRKPTKNDRPPDMMMMQQPNRSHKSNSYSYSSSDGKVFTEYTVTDATAADNARTDEPTPAAAPDESCFVCGQDGRLLLCDFPLCTRAFHQICLLKVFPDPLDDLMMDYGASRFDEGSSPRADKKHSLAEIWFCPSHTCVGCHALDSTAIKGVSLSMKDLPLSLLAQFGSGRSELGIPGLPTRSSDSSSNGDRGAAYTKKPTRRSSALSKPQEVEGVTGSSSSRIGHIALKPLRACISCPFSVCMDCEECLLGMCTPKALPDSVPSRTHKRGPPVDKLFVAKSSSDCSGSIRLECLNCNSRDPTLKLARLLEKAWYRLSSSRLAMPFLRPLLPITSSPTIATLESQQAESSESTPDDEDPVTEVIGGSAASRRGRGRDRPIGAVDMPSELGNSTFEHSDDHSDPAAFDFLSLLERIHRLAYRSAGDFYSDLNTLRRQVQEKIDRLHSPIGIDGGEGEAVDQREPSSHSVLLALDTAVDACHEFLAGKSLWIESLEQSIRDRSEGESRSHDVSEGMLLAPADAASLMKRLWRVECEHVVPKKVLSRCLLGGRSRCCDVQLSMEMGPGSSQQFSVPHRSLAGWQRFVEMGAMPASSVRCSSSSSFDGQFDPYTLQSQIASNRLQHGREASQKAAVRQVLEGVYSTEDLEAASLLSGQNY